MKIGVVGNCQAPGIGMALKQLREEDEVLAIAAQGDCVERVAMTLQTCEVIFAHRLPKALGPLAIDVLRETHRHVWEIPPIAFTGFHPDCIYILDGQAALPSPMAVYHSAIAAASFALGADVNAALAQFNTIVFSKLGYFQEFAKARTFLERTMQGVGLEMAEDWPLWMARAPFMHLVNHPKAFVLASIARLLAMRAELLPTTAAPVEPVQDLLSLHPVWPWYPELAEFSAGQGGYLFKRNGLPDLAAGQGVFMTLRDFVEGSFAAYAAYPAHAFSIPAVERVRRVLQETL